MARQPKLILRESCVDDVMKNWPIGSFLETGSGTGYMTKKLLSKGFFGASYELGYEAREKLKENLQEYTKNIEILDSLEKINNKFDYLFSFEVLEHIENDLDALKSWTRHLKPGGKILLSVPAHQKKYGKSDAIVGHIRRYEKSEMKDLLVNAGYENIKIINYGFPITEITRAVSNILISDKLINRDLSMQERSTQSSFNRQSHIRKIIDFFGEKWMIPFCKMQRMSYTHDWGDGIIATAQKSHYQ